MAVIRFPAAPLGQFCQACGRLAAKHGATCARDEAVGRDQETSARRLRLARLQLRAIKVRTLREHFDHCEAGD